MKAQIKITEPPSNGPVAGVGGEKPVVGVFPDYLFPSDAEVLSGNLADGSKPIGILTRVEHWTPDMSIGYDVLPQAHESVQPIPSLKGMFWIGFMMGAVFAALVLAVAFAAWIL